jgi:hypothetical protein
MSVSRGRWLLFAIMTLLVTGSAVAGVTARQDRAGGAPADVPALLKQLEDRNDATVERAIAQLVKIGPSAGPGLVTALRERRGCQLRWVASGILSQLKIEQPAVDAALIEIATGRCEARSSNDAILKREAAFIVVAKVQGVPVIAGLLNEKDTFLRRSAAFAFDELTERLEGRPPAITATPDMLAATLEALPLLSRAVAQDKDEVVRCMSYEALDQARRSAHELLRFGATKALEGVTVACRR